MNPQTNATPGRTQEDMSFEKWWNATEPLEKWTNPMWPKAAWQARDVEIASLRALLDKHVEMEGEALEKLEQAQAKISALTKANEEKLGSLIDLANELRSYEDDAYCERGISAQGEINLAIADKIIAAATSMKG